MSRTFSEPHKIMVRVWHNCNWHHIQYTAETSSILRFLHREGQDFYNPTDREWNVLSNYRDVPLVAR